MSGHFEEKRSAGNAALRASIDELETVGNDYADLMLLDATVHVDLDGLEASFTLPPKAAEAFQSIGAPAPQLIETIDLDLRYDRAEQQFSVVRGGAAFDNGYGIAFTEPQDIPGYEEGYHHLDLFRRDSEGRLRFQRAGLSPTSDVQGFFQQCGVHIPMAPYQASWDALVPTLALARQRVTIASQAVILPPVHELLVTEQIVESRATVHDEDLAGPSSGWLRRATPAHANNADQTDAAEHAWVRELSLQVLDYKDIAVRAFEAVLRAESPLERPCFREAYRRNTGRHFPTGSDLIAGQTDTEPIQVQEEQLPLDTELVQYLTFAIQALRAASRDILG